MMKNAIVDMLKIVQSLDTAVIESRVNYITMPRAHLVNVVINVNTKQGNHFVETRYYT